MANNFDVEKIVNFIEDNLTVKLTINDIANYFHYSKYYLIRVFSKYTGFTPILYYRRRRLKEITAMKTAGKTYYEIAHLFNTSASAIARAFKEEYNCTITEFLLNEVELKLQDKLIVNPIDADWSNALNDIDFIDKVNGTYYCHSYPASIATVLSYYNNESLSLDDVLFYSGFAFRIDVHKNLCPSATSIFSWERELKFALDNCGIKSTRIERSWNDIDKRDELRELAITSVKLALQQNLLPICWDLIIPEWSIVTGYCEKTDSLLCVGPDNMKSAIKTKDLGQREIELLDVTIIKNTKLILEDNNFNNAIKWAISHYEGNQWTDKPAYAQGLEAWKLWISALKNTSADIESLRFSNRYYANYVGCGRYAAYTVFNKLGYTKLSNCYKEIASHCFNIIDSIRKCSDSIDKEYIINQLNMCYKLETSALEMLKELID